MGSLTFMLIIALILSNIASSMLIVGVISILVQQDRLKKYVEAIYEKERDRP